MVDSQHEARGPREHAPREGRRDPRLRPLAEESGYSIRGRIGAGGMGIVYRAEDADGRDVAIKLLRHEIADDPRARQRLAREVAAQRLVRTPNIVRILDAELDSSDSFIVTEFIPGPTLEEAVRVNGALHPEAVREIGLTLGRTLRAIHDAGVVHRDLKPSNIMLRNARIDALDGFDPDGDALDPVIIDFGIAMAAEESRLTSTGLVMGTAAYLDPEVVRTDRTGPASDWWALAALLCFAATGREPFGSGRADLVFLRADRGEIDVDGLPTQLAAWLRQGLTADPERRPDPVAWIGELDDLDLEIYDDPGETEVIDREVLAAESADRTEALPVAGPRTAVLPVVPDDARQAGEDIEVDGPDREDSAEPATQVLETVGEERWDDDRHDEEPATERLDRVPDPTRPLPVVSDPGPWERPPRSGPIPAPHPQALPPQQTMPQRSGPPVRTAYAPPPQPQGGPAGPYAGGPYQQAAPYPAGPYQAGPVGPWAPPVPPPPRRPWLVMIGHLLLVALGALAPYIALMLMVLVGALARTWERSHRAISDRRLRGAQGSGPLWAAGAAWPFRFLLGALEIILQAVLPLVLGLAVGLALDAGITLATGTSPPDSLALGSAVAVTLLLTWVGLGSRTTRLGTHRMVDAAAPDRMWSAVVGGLALAVLAAVVVAIMSRQGSADYFPFATWWHLGDLAVWRR